MGQKLLPAMSGFLHLTLYRKEELINNFVIARYVGLSSSNINYIRLKLIRLLLPAMSGFLHLT